MKWLGRWFWSPIKTGENSAQTLVRVLGNLFRSVLTVVVVGVALIIVLSAYYSSKSSADYAATQADKEKIYVKVTLMEDADRGEFCEREFPLVVYVRNDSSKALMSMTIDLTAREVGASTNVLTYPDDRIVWDKIVPPQHELFMCWGINRKHDGLTYSGKAQTYMIELESVEPWMLKESTATKIKQTN